MSSHAADIAKYTTVDQSALAGMEKTYRLVMSKADTRLVAATDKTERERVRNNFLKKKLGLSYSNADLDAAVSEILERMKDDRAKSRLTVYYLLAEKYGKLGMFA